MRFLKKSLDKMELNLPVIILLAVILSIIIMAIGAEIIAPHSPLKINLVKRFMPPAFIEGGDWSYPLGTDGIGRDILSRIIFGARVSLITASTALFIGGAVGATVGLVAAIFEGRWVSVLLMRIVDSLIPIPMIVTGLLMAMIFGPSLRNVVIAIAIISTSRYARVIRGEALGVLQQDFIAQARVAGSSMIRIIWQHLFPNVINTVLVMVTLMVGWAILVEASLSFLGAGIPPPAPSWGRMVAEGRDYVDTAWWISVLPGTTVLVVVICVNLLGDWLRDRLDPKLRQV
ncbi:ABC transporter permease [Chloroflexota bacterium]